MDFDLNTVIMVVAGLVFVVALIAIGGWLLKGMRSGGGGGILRGRERRLGVVEAASVDARRKLLLLRRDDVEHLIMIGGPVDVLIESGIEQGHPYDRSIDYPPEPVRDDGRVVIARDETRPTPGSHDQD